VNEEKRVLFSTEKSKLNLKVEINEENHIQSKQMALNNNIFA